MSGASVGVSGGAAVREHLWRLQESDKEALAFLFAMFMPFGGSWQDRPVHCVVVPE